MPSKRTPTGAEAPADASDAAEAPTDSKTPPTDGPSPNEPPDSRTPATVPPSRRATPPEPPPTPAAKNDRGLNRDGIIGSNATLTAAPDAAPAPTPAKSQRRTRALTVPPDTVARIEKSGLNRTDLMRVAIMRYAHVMPETARRKIQGRVRLCISLNDDEYARLVRIAKRQAWPISPTAAALIELYLNELDEKPNKKPNRPRAQR